MAAQPETPTPFAWKQPWAWTDVAKQRKERSPFAVSRTAEIAYERQLKSVAGQIRKVVTENQPQEVERLLREYVKVLEPWAQQSVTTMLAGVNRKNVQAWSSAAQRMGVNMRALLNSPGVGAVLQSAIAHNVTQVKGLADKAADDIAGIVRESMITGSRAEDLAKRIAKVAKVTESRAATIARTEVSKAGTALTMARAKTVESEGYIWRTARDGDSRPSHRAMEGKFVRWDEQPTIDGMTGHAGEFPNCRCYPEPVIPQEGGGTYRAPLPTQAQERKSEEKLLLSKWEQESSSPVIPHAPDAPLVNADKAVFEKAKLSRYALNPKHPTGKDKARVFKAALGVDQRHVELVEKQIMTFLPYAKAEQGKSDKHGVRFTAKIPVTGPNGKTTEVLTAWIYPPVEGKKAVSTRPRLLTIFVPEESNAL